jgi:ABC-type sugar transport system substrate-binding protein
MNMFRTSSIRAAFGAIVVCGLLCGCDRRSDDSGKPKVGVILMQQDQFFRLNEFGMKSAAEKLGLDLRVQNAAGALNREIDLIETFAMQRVAALLVSPLSATASAQALQRAADAGIRIVAYNNPLPAGFVAAEVTSDQAALGRITGEFAREFIERRRKGKARVVIISFASQLPEQSIARSVAFKRVINLLPGVNVIAEQDAWEAPQAANVVGELLSKDPDVIWAANEGGTVGAVTAVKNAGKAGQIVVFGTDISRQIIDFLLSKDDILQAVGAQQPIEMGEAAVQAAADLIGGKPVERSQVIPARLLTRERPDEIRGLQARLLEASR